MQPMKVGILAESDEVFARVLDVPGIELVRLVPGASPIGHGFDALGRAGEVGGLDVDDAWWATVLTHLEPGTEPVDWRELPPVALC